MSLINIANAAGGVIDNAPTLAQLLLKVLNFCLEIFGIIAIISIVIAGIIYLTASGDERRIEKAKKMTLYSIIGIAAALGGMIIIKTISGIL
jgi:hypothetical protein